MGAGMIIVNRGDGRLFNVQPNDLAAFIAANPGAKALKGEVKAPGPTEAEVAATNAQGFSGMTVPQLKAHAEESGIDLAGATVKADIIAAIEAAESAAENEAD